MRFGDKSFADHLRLLQPCLVLILIVWALRFLAFWMGLPDYVVRLLSVSGAIPLAIILAALLIHVRRFGGYVNLIVASAVLVCFGQALIILAIILGSLGLENTYSLSRGAAGRLDPTLHVFGHLLAIPLGTLVGSIIGAIFFWMLGRTLPHQRI